MGVMGVIYFDWTDDAVERLRAAVQEGQSANEFSRNNPGCSRNAAIGKAKRLGIHFRGSRYDGSTNLKQACGIGPGKIGRPPTAPKPPREPKPKAIRLEAPKPPPKPPAKIEAPGPILVCRHTCVWPIGDPGEAGFGYCGAPAVKTYCEEHAEASRSKHARPFVASKVAGSIHSVDARGPVYRW